MTEHEKSSTDYAETSPLMLFLLNGTSSMMVICRYLLTLDGLLSAILSAGFTYYVYHISQDDETFDGTMSFVLLGFAVIMPLSVSIRITFERRERALKSIASLRTHAYMIYLCHCVWDWGSDPGGRKKSGKNWVEHSDAVLEKLIQVGDDLARLLTLPNSTRPRHRQLKSGRKEAAITVKASYQLMEGIISHNVTKISMLCEELKHAGLSPSESSRLRNWEKFFVVAVEDLRMVKMYRSPNALRSLSNVFTIILPPLYAPAFAQIAHDTDSLELAIFVAVIASLALTALYAAIEVLEDPFVAFLTLDGIDVHEELSVLYYRQLMLTRGTIFPGRPCNFDAENDGSARRRSVSYLNEGEKNLLDKQIDSDDEVSLRDIWENDSPPEKNAPTTASASASADPLPPPKRLPSRRTKLLASTTDRRGSSVCLVESRAALMASLNLSNRISNFSLDLQMIGEDEGTSLESSS